MLNSGDILEGKYEVIRILGKGGMGVVYLCRNNRLLSLWAIKEIIQDTKNIDILTEANILKGLNHVGIRRIIDMFYENNNLYMVQEYVEGQTLKEYVRVNGKIPTKMICGIISDLCDIVGYLHNLNPAIIYRDIKPANIIITPSEKVVLIDFGISKVYKNDTVCDPACAGSNGYAAPEQYGSGKCCTQTDIYGIGMLMYFMLKGRDPSTGVEPLLDESYDVNMDSNLRKTIQKCVQINVIDRCFSVDDLKKEISNVLKKDSYEKVKLNIINKSKFKKTINGFLYFIVVILASIFVLYGNKNDGIDRNTADRTEIGSPVFDLKSIEEDNINESNIMPIKETIIIPKERTKGLMRDN
jgi:serine/threonine protein kinase